MHPELTYEPDMAEIMRGHGQLAGLLLDTSEAERVQGGARLRETLNQLKRVEVALEESESRHAFLLRLGDAVKLLADPMAIQDEASSGCSASGSRLTVPTTRRSTKRRTTS